MKLDLVAFLETEFPHEIREEAGLFLDRIREVCTAVDLRVDMHDGLVVEDVLRTVDPFSESRP